MSERRSDHAQIVADGQSVRKGLAEFGMAVRVMNTRPEPCIRIDGVIVETASLTAGLPETANSFHRIDLAISVQTILHELQECGVEVTEQTMADFLWQGAQDEGRLT